MLVLFFHLKQFNVKIGRCGPGADAVHECNWRYWPTTDSAKPRDSSPHSAKRTAQPNFSNPNGPIRHHQGALTWRQGCQFRSLVIRCLENLCLHILVFPDRNSLFKNFIFETGYEFTLTYAFNDCIHVNELELCFLGTNWNKGLKSKKKTDTYQNRTISFRIRNKFF